MCRPSVAARTEGVQNKRRGITLRHVARDARPTRADDRVSDDSWGGVPVDPQRLRLSSSWPTCRSGLNYVCFNQGEGRFGEECVGFSGE